MTIAPKWPTAWPPGTTSPGRRKPPEPRTSTAPEPPSALFPLPLKQVDNADATYLFPYLLAGWALAIPDHEGPQAYFGVGLEAGAITLDGIRAVKSFTEDDSIGPDSPVGMSGYSGGAHVTGWAAQMQPTYAPELKLVGAAVGGIPANYAAVARNIDGGPFAGFEFGLFDSLVRAYPSAGISALLNARGRQDLETITGMCQTRLP
jgi:Secretory lipase